jgi:hypothetical protein
MKVSTEVSRKIAEVTAKPIRFDEFNDVIGRAKSDKAPGPSGFTINMLKSLSTDSKRFIHQSMTVMWEKKFIPQWMKDRMMAVIPKKSGDPTMPLPARAINKVEQAKESGDPLLATLWGIKTLSLVPS